MHSRPILTLLAAIALCGSAAAQDAKVFAEAPAPRLVWERAIELHIPPAADDERPDPMSGVMAFAARPDGGAVIVGADPAKPTLRLPRLVALDGDGKVAFAQTLSLPAGAQADRMINVSIRLDAARPGPLWLFHSWESGSPADADSQPTRSRLIGLDNGGRQIAESWLPRRVARDPAFVNPRRRAAVLRRMGDGSLLVGGTINDGPPVWWFARFSTSGRFLYEQASRGHPDFVEDAHVNPDGGFSLMMFDTDLGESEKVALRRYGADGRLVERVRMPEFRYALYCAILLGPRLQLRAQGDEDATKERSKSELVWHEPGTGIIERLGLGARSCERLDRADNTVVMTSAAVPIVDDGPLQVSAIVDRKLRWHLKSEEPAQAVALPDGGALVLRVLGGPKDYRLSLARYAWP